MDSIYQKLREPAAGADNKTRLELINFASDLIQSLETPADILQRIGYASLQTSIARLGIDPNIFKMLTEAKTALTDVEFAEPVKADPLLISRITRCLASYGMIVEAGPGQYLPNKVTQTFSQTAFEGAFHHLFSDINPGLLELPTYLADTTYQSPKNPQRSARNKVFNTSLSFFEWLNENPENLQWAALYMTTWREGVRSWLDIYPIEAEVQRQTEHHKDRKGTHPLFVDVGGGFGHQCHALREKFPGLPGKIILEDLPEVLQQAPPPEENMEFVAQNFRHPQTLREPPMFFYLRNVLHDYPDAPCVTILTHLRDALTNSRESKILIDEMVIPETGASQYTTNLDMVMMSLTASWERTLSQFQQLVESVGGLKMERSFTFDQPLGLTIIETGLT